MAALNAFKALTVHATDVAGIYSVPWVDLSDDEKNALTSSEAVTGEDGQVYYLADNAGIDRGTVANNTEKQALDPAPTHGEFVFQNNNSTVFWFDARPTIDGVVNPNANTWVVRSGSEDIPPDKTLAPAKGVASWVPLVPRSDDPTGDSSVYLATTKATAALSAQILASHETVRVGESIQDAIDKVRATGLPGTVLLEHGAHGIEAPIVMKTGVELTCGSKGSASIHATTTMNYLVQASASGNYSTLKNVTLDASLKDGSDAPLVSNMAFYINGEGASVEDIKIVGTSDADSCDGITIQAGSSDLKIKGVIYDGLNTGLKNTGGFTDSIVKDCEYKNSWFADTYFSATDATGGLERVVFSGSRYRAPNVLSDKAGWHLAFRRESGGALTTYHKQITIKEEKAFGNGMPYIIPDPLDRTTKTANGASPDNFSILSVDGLTMDDCWSHDGGDVGMTISVGTRNAVITNSGAIGSDTSGMDIGISDGAQTTSNITVVDFTALNNGVDGEGKGYITQGVKVVNGDNVKLIRTNSQGHEYGVRISESTDVEIDDPTFINNTKGDVFCDDGSYAPKHLETYKVFKGTGLEDTTRRSKGIFQDAEKHSAGTYTVHLSNPIAAGAAIKAELYDTDNDIAVTQDDPMTLSVAITAKSDSSPTDAFFWIGVINGSPERDDYDMTGAARGSAGYNQKFARQPITQEDYKVGRNWMMVNLAADGDGSTIERFVPSKVSGELVWVAG